MKKMKVGVFVLMFMLVFCSGTIMSFADDNDAPQPVEDELWENGSEFEHEFEDKRELDIFDPLSGYNRLMTRVNDKLYYWVLKPVSKGYGFLMPEPGRVAIRRCFNNIMFPIRFVNNILQFKMESAGVELARFGVNSTVGVLGFGDPARSWLDLEPKEEDFGQTLGYYGLGGGFHLVLPFFGPSNLRDTAGMVPDAFLNPVNYTGTCELKAGLKAGETINTTSMRIGEYEDFQKSAIDFYILMRDTYEAHRMKKIEE